MATNISRTPSPDTDTLLEGVHQKKLEEHSPLIAFLLIMAFIGIIGNILTIIFYGYRVKITSTIALIRLLAVLDLVVCFLCFTTIADLFFNILYTDEILCKVMYFFDHWFVVSSVFTLWIISIDRYRRMCKPLGKQLTVKSASIAVIIMSLFSMVFSAHDFITYGIVKVNMSTTDEVFPYVLGHYCTNTDTSDLQIVVIVFHVLDAVTIAACLVTFVFTYGNIWRSLRKHNIKTGHLHKSSSAISRQSMSDFNSKTVQIEEDVANDIEATEPLNNYPAVHFSLSSNLNTDSLKVSPSVNSFASVESKLTTPNVENARRTSKSSKTSRTERSLTIMMFAVTIGFVVCFTPYFIVCIGVRWTSATTEDELHTGIEFALRSPFWNSVINPIIFCVFNTQYRRYVKDVFTSCSINRSTINSSQG